MPLAYSYIRFSTTAQSADQGGDSFRRQLDRAAQWAQANGYTLADVGYQDLGVSGWKRSAKRDGLTALLDAIGSGKIAAGSVVVLDSLDRLSRAGIVETRRLIAQVVQQGVDLVDLTTDTMITAQTLNDLSTDLNVGLGAWLAHQESEKKSQRVGAQRAAAALRARDGHQIRRRLPFWLTFDKQGQPQINDQGQTVRRIVDERLCGAGLAAIAKGLNLDGIASPNSKGWSDQTVRYVLGNPTLCGVYRQKDGHEIADYYPSVCTRQEWLDVQPMRTKRAAKLSPKSCINGITKCARCGRGLKRVEAPRNGKVYVSYVCRGRLQGLCDLPRWVDLDRHIRAACVHLGVAVGAGGQSTNSVDNARRRQEIDARIGELESSLSRGIAVSAILNSIEQLQAERSQLVDPVDVDQTALVMLVDEQDPVRFNVLLRRVVSRIEVGAFALGSVVARVIRHDGASIVVKRGTGKVISGPDHMRDLLRDLKAGERDGEWERERE